MKCYIFDIDGTLADLSHRLHFIKGDKKDWNSFKHFCFADKPIEHMVDLARMLSWSYHSKHCIVLMSGRNECQRVMTEEWLHPLNFRYAGLYMRADGDYRPDHVIKAELLAKVRSDGYEPIMAFDDRNQVVAMWRKHGVPCAQVAEGDF